MKYLTLICVILASICLQAYAQDGVCATHPWISKLSEFVTNLEGEFTDSEKYTELTAAIEEYKTRDGDDVWNAAEDVEKCSLSQGGPSCCNDNMVTLLQFAVKSKLRRSQKNDQPKYRQFKKRIIEGLGKCGGKALVTKFAAGEALVELDEQFEVCYKAQKAQQIKFLEGTACTLCMMGSQIAELFNADEQLTVRTAHLDELDEESVETIECMNGLSEGMEAYIDAFFEENDADLPKSKKCKNLKLSIKKRFADKDLETESTGCKAGLKALGEDGSEGGCYGKNEAGQSLKGDLTKAVVVRRILQDDSDDSDFVDSGDASGYPIYYDQGDEGDLFEEFDAAEEADAADEQDLIQDFQTEPEADSSDEESDDDSSTLLKLSVGVVLLMFVTIV